MSDLPAEHVIEDAEFLVETGVGTTEAAQRLHFPTARALERWLKRHNRHDLWLSFQGREAA